MAAVNNISVQQVKDCSNDDLVHFLSKNGISQTGLKSLRDNQVEGDMLLDFTDADLKDLFEVFKDRFLIRKLLRELYGPNNQCRLAKPIAHPVITIKDDGVSKTSESSLKAPPVTDYIKPAMRSPESFSKPLRTTEVYPKSLTIPESHSKTMRTPESYLRSLITSEPSSRSTGASEASSKSSRVAELYPRTLKANEGTLTRSLAPTMCSKTPTTSSSSLNGNSKSLMLLGSHTKQVTPKASSFPKIIRTSETNAKPAKPVDPEKADTFIPVEFITSGAERIRQFSPEEILKRKIKRGRPSEAQRLGRSLIREAASSAKIWKTAPPLRQISAEQKEIFFKYVTTVAPQLVSHKNFVWMRLGESLQNRRKYLSDKVNGRRTTKRDKKLRSSHDPDSLISVSGDDQDTEMSSPLVLQFQPEQTDTMDLTTLIKEEAETMGMKFWLGKAE